jgi:hypothetical protein
MSDRSKQSNNLADQINAALAKAHTELVEQDVLIISPSVVAARAMQILDPDKRSPNLVEYAAILELRQLSRAMCRRQYDATSEEAIAQGTLFAGLSARYPVLRDGVEGYVPRLKMTLAERMQVPPRYRQVGQSIIEHADAFEAETNRLIADGYFDKAA